ncbi:motility associated factor glycosyltransferase family protein [bacterium]|nr:motility associated factor glycosyltransferase family protein [bacterium]
MNNLFYKNLSALAKKNQNLAMKLEKYVPLELATLVNQNGNYNLQYKNKLIHDSQNPLLEAQNIFKQIVNVPTSIHFVYGLGLGYLFQLISLNSKGTVILYEPDLNILWISFTLVDFSADILKDNVYITDNFDEASSVIYSHSATKTTPQLISLPSQRGFDPQGFDSLVLKLQNLIGSFSLDLKYTKEKLYPALLMLMNNIPFLQNEIPLVHYKDCLKGKTAVVVSAGPTLDRNIEMLKKNRDKYVLFTVGTALKTLYANDIKPDFLVVIETYNSSRQVEGLDLSDVYFITEPYSNPDLRNFKFKQVLSHISVNMPINHLWGEICGENIEEYWSKGTVSYTALNCARLLGCSKIILVGQDLAYIEGQCYSKDSVYKDLICGVNPETNRWEIMAKDFDKFASAISTSPDKNIRDSVAKRRLTNLNNSLHLVKGINGDMIPTESVYATFVKPLEEFVQEFNDREYINTSLVGAQIDGYKNISLEEALSDCKSIDKPVISGDFKPDLKNIQTNLSEILKDLDVASKLLSEEESALKDLFNNLKRARNLSSEVLKSLKRVSVIYMNLSDELTQKSKIWDYISVQYRIDIDYEIKMTEQFSIENITNLANKIKSFVLNSRVRISEVKELARKVNESFNSKG